MPIRADVDADVSDVCYWFVMLHCGTGGAEAECP